MVCDVWPCWRVGRGAGGRMTTSQTFSFLTLRFLGGFQVEASSTPLALGVECSGEAWLDS